MLVAKTNLGLVPLITLTFIGLRKHLVIGQLNEYQFFSTYHWFTNDTPPASHYITVQGPISKTLCGPCIAAIAGYKTKGVSADKYVTFQFTFILFHVRISSVLYLEHTF